MTQDIDVIRATQPADPLDAAALARPSVTYRASPELLAYSAKLAITAQAAACAAQTKATQRQRLDDALRGLRTLGALLVVAIMMVASIASAVATIHWSLQ